MTEYDPFSPDYDRFVNWQSRLAVELPWIDTRLQALGVNGRPTRVLDAACGTGIHALALAQLGYSPAGADLSAGMIARARMNASRAGVVFPLAKVGFGNLADAFRGSPLFPFDAVVCLGNSLPHVLTREELARAVTDFSACLRPGGFLLIQNRNFDAVVEQKERWMEPQACQENNHEWLFHRFYDYRQDGLIDFNIITFQREVGKQDWKQSVVTTCLRPILWEEMRNLLAEAGFQRLEFFGNLRGAPFDPKSSGNLVAVAYKPAD